MHFSEYTAKAGSRILPVFLQPEGVAAKARALRLLPPVRLAGSNLDSASS
jgi:hypothetical protein